MLELHNYIYSLFSFYILRQLFMIIVFLIVIDFFWKKQDFKFSYAVIRWVLLVNWIHDLLQIPFNWDEMSSFFDRATGPYWWAYWFMIIGGFILPVLLIHKKLGRNKWMILLVAFLATFSLTFELFVILITSMHQDFSGSSTVPLYLSHLFLRPFIITGFLIGLDVLLMRNRSQRRAAQSSEEDILDGELD
jgi:hypothetical protein